MMLEREWGIRVLQEGRSSDNVADLSAKCGLVELPVVYFVHQDYPGLRVLLRFDAASIG